MSTIDVEDVPVRTGTTTAWASADAPILDVGEVGVDLTTGEFKVGDGSTTFQLLTAANFVKVAVTLVAGTKTTADTRIRAGSIINPVYHTLGTVTSPKTLTVTRSNGVSFTVTSSDNTDTSTLDVLIRY